MSTFWASIEVPFFNIFIDSGTPYHSKGVNLEYDLITVNFFSFFSCLSLNDKKRLSLPNETFYSEELDNFSIFFEKVSTDFPLFFTSVIQRH